MSVPAEVSRRFTLAQQGQLKLSKARPTEAILKAMGATPEQTRIIMDICREIDNLGRTPGGIEQVASWGLGCNDSCGMREEFVARIQTRAR